MHIVFVLLRLLVNYVALATSNGPEDRHDFGPFLLLIQLLELKRQQNL